MISSERTTLCWSLLFVKFSFTALYQFVEEENISCMMILYFYFIS